MIVYKSNGAHHPYCNYRCDGDSHYLWPGRAEGVSGDVMVELAADMQAEAESA